MSFDPGWAEAAGLQLTENCKHGQVDSENLMSRVCVKVMLVMRTLHGNCTQLVRKWIEHGVNTGRKA